MGDQNEAGSTPAVASAGSQQAPAVPAAGTPPQTPAADEHATSRSKAFEAAEHYKAQAQAAEKRAAAAEAKLKADEDKRLADEGNFRELAKREEEARKAAEAKGAESEQRLKDAERRIDLLAEAQVLGLRSPSYLKLADPSLPPKEALAALKASDPSLFGPSDPKTNNTTVANNPAGGKPFDPSEQLSAEQIRELSKDKAKWDAYKAQRMAQSGGGSGNPWVG